MKIYSIILLIFTSLPGFSQRLSYESLDSLQVIWDSSENVDSIRFEALNTFIEKGYLRYANDSAQYYAEIHFDLALQKSNHLQKAKALNLKGLSYAMRGNMDSCLVYFKKSFLVHQEIDNLYGAGRAAFNLGNVFSSTGPLDSAVFYYDYSSQIYETLQDTAGISKGLFASSKVARRNGDFEFALKQMEKSIELEKSFALPVELSLSYGDKGTLLKKLSRYREATEAFKMSYEFALKSGASTEIVAALNKLVKLKLEEKDPEKALEYLEEVKNVTDQNTEPYVHIVSVLYKGHSLKDLGRNEEAIQSYEKAIKLSKEAKETGLISTNYISLAQLAEGTGDYQIALEYYKLTEENDNKLDYSEPDALTLYGYSACYRNLGNIPLAIKYAQDAVDVSERKINNGTALESYKCLYLAYQEAGNYEKAFSSFSKWNELRKLINSEENQKSAVKLEYDYLYEKKSLTDSLNFATQKVILEQETKTQRRISSYAIIGLAIFSLLSFFLFRLYSQNKKKNIIISKSLVEKDTLLREIHHRVKNNLQVISSLLRLQSNSTKDEVAIEALTESQSRVQSMSLIHQNLYGEDNLTGIGMKNYLEQLSKNLLETYNTGGNVKLTTDIEDLKLDVDTVVPLGLIINELITNSLKYAFPKQIDGEITIILKKISDKLHLVVKDNGIGISDELNVEDGNSFGFGLINAFTSKLDAQLEIKNADGAEVELIIREFDIKSD